jgi:hypothetical protein
VRTNAREHRFQVGVAPVDLDPLRPAADVRRDVRADTQALSSQQCRREERRRRLAVRADDVDRRVVALRVAEVGEQPLDPREAEVLRPRRE